MAAVVGVRVAATKMTGNLNGNHQEYAPAFAVFFAGKLL